VQSKLEVWKEPRGKDTYGAGSEWEFRIEDGLLKITTKSSGNMGYTFTVYPAATWKRMRQTEVRA
jgi:hypothetical protein